jgi:hypothetical protein
MVHAVVINLNKRTDRWQSLQQHLQETNLPFLESVQRLSAVENTANPSLGCLLSHAAAIRLAIENKWESVMVLEDDVRFRANSENIFAQMHEDLKQLEWQAVFGASVRVLRRDITPCVVPPNPRISTRLFALRPQGCFTGTHCMMYHQRAYDSILALVEQAQQTDPLVPHHIDYMLSSTLTNVYLCVPFLAFYLEHDVSDVRLHKDTSQDYALICSADQQTTTWMSAYHDHLIRKRQTQSSLI